MRYIQFSHRPLPTPDSRLPTPDSRLPTPDSRLPTPDSRLPNDSQSRTILAHKCPCTILPTGKQQRLPS
ncbi:MAG: hypothetical protein F6K63_28715 [Moorea sp. SIO1G6]|uniref:hypothetical protein n=1 Tax=Moorena sp. SIO1G6 TaxID=2607840 RepID=UPI0013C10E39|nr:hypothetical protein [Moorena sp. SIO1G6]NET68159.1 hypothetical protein [Moorena sp. SIO1G6]